MCASNARQTKWGSAARIVCGLSYVRLTCVKSASRHIRHLSTYKTQEASKVKPSWSTLEFQSVSLLTTSLCIWRNVMNIRLKERIRNNGVCCLKARSIADGWTSLQRNWLKHESTAFCWTLKHDCALTKWFVVVPCLTSTTAFGNTSSTVEMTWKNSEFIWKSFIQRNFNKILQLLHCSNMSNLLLVIYSLRSRFFCRLIWMQGNDVELNNVFLSTEKSILSNTNVKLLNSELPKNWRINSRSSLESDAKREKLNQKEKQQANSSNV